MPLHLLGKKSWNVYNHDNVERVKRDEAEAAAQELAEEQRMQEIDAERRIRLLQGLPVEELKEEEKEQLPKVVRSSDRSQQTYSERDRKRRRHHGEDDTDRDIRHAKETQLREHDDQTRRQKRTRDAPLHDKRGHINLFPESKDNKETDRSGGNPEAELEKARKERELEDQYTLRFSNAAGFRQAVDTKPWYHGESMANDADQQPPSVNVWGNEDPKRKQREEIRMASDDPLAAIQRGVKGVRQAEKDRKDWRDRQRRDIDEMIEQERDTVTRHSTEDDLEGFSLDAGSTSAEKRKHREQRRHRHRHHHREGGRDRSRSRSRRRHVARDRDRSKSPRKGCEDGVVRLKNR